MRSKVGFERLYVLLLTVHVQVELGQIVVLKVLRVLRLVVVERLVVHAPQNETRR